MTQSTEDIADTISAQAGLQSVDSTQITTPPELIVLDNMTERIKSSYFVCPPGEFPMTTEGDSSVYTDDIFNEAGEVVGHTVGMARVLRIADGKVITQFEEIVELGDGIVRGIGAFDRNAILAGECVRLQVEGMSGRYVGMSGFREWQLIPPISRDGAVALRIVLAG
jgi:Allene oxide cyclase barrel like domain